MSNKTVSGSEIVCFVILGQQSNLRTGTDLVVLLRKEFISGSSV